MSPQFQVPVVIPQQRTSGLAITGMVLGILSFFLGWLYLVVPILAIIFSGIGISQVNRNPDLGGKGMAITGLVCGIINLALYGILWLAIGWSVASLSSLAV
jgi:hypothetical protein